MPIIARLFLALSEPARYANAGFLNQIRRISHFIPSAVAAPNVMDLEKRRVARLARDVMVRALMSWGEICG
jgi:hypothetical protein